MMGYFALVIALFHGVPFVLVPDKPLTPGLITDVIHATKPTAATIPPSLLEEMSHSKRALEAISSLDHLFFGGAALSPEIGGRLSRLTNLVNVIGTSECGLIATLAPRGRDDWLYHEWNPAYGIDMQPVGGNMFELVIPRGPTREWHGIFHTFPGLQEYRTKDVYTRSPTNPNGWLYYGRIDDVVVLSNGEKFNPVTMEKVIESHPLLSGAVVAGQGRFQSALLVEPNWNEWSENQPESALVEKIWPVVEQANAGAVAHSRIAKSKIGISSRSKPFKRTAKGSIQRHHVYREYEKELEAIYAREEEDIGIELPEKPDLPAIRDYIHQVFSSLFPDFQIGERDDIYAAGFDSLQTVQFSGVLRKAFSTRFPQGDSEAITAQQIYSHPTIETLSGFVNSLVNGGANGSYNGAEARRVMLDDLVRKHAEGLPVQEQDVDVDVKDDLQTHTIILTGSTGSLGNYVLDALLNDPSTAKVYCLNRSADGESRQTNSFREKGLKWDNSRRAKVEFLKASFGAEKFGLEDAKYAEMLISVDTVIHNAWKVDFNQSVWSFEDTHIRGVRHFIDFSLRSAHHAHLHFVSSVATIGAWAPKHGPAVTEEPVEDPDVTIPQGYGESKHVAERLCLTASRQSGVPTTILRVGQIAGPTTANGEWNRQEWLPTIIATSKATGRIPNTLAGSVNWIPVVS
jgi:nucleoside-diphosphate-sugar epimerase